jgi:hypothetical protein
VSARDDRTKDEILEERVLLKRAYAALFEVVSEILFRYDPMGIDYEHNTDEYEPEVGTILPRLHGCNSKDDTRRIVHQEFMLWFDGDAGDEASYDAIASDIWDAWQNSVCSKN